MIFLYGSLIRDFLWYIEGIGFFQEFRQYRNSPVSAVKIRSSQVPVESGLEFLKGIQNALFFCIFLDEPNFISPKLVEIEQGQVVGCGHKLRGYSDGFLEEELEKFLGYQGVEAPVYFVNDDSIALLQKVQHRNQIHDSVCSVRLSRKIELYVLILFVDKVRGFDFFDGQFTRNNLDVIRIVVGATDSIENVFVLDLLSDVFFYEIRDLELGIVKGELVKCEFVHPCIEEGQAVVVEFPKVFVFEESDFDPLDFGLREYDGQFASKPLENRFEQILDFCYILLIDKIEEELVFSRALADRFVESFGFSTLESQVEFDINLLAIVDPGEKPRLAIFGGSFQVFFFDCAILNCNRVIVADPVQENVIAESRFGPRTCGEFESWHIPLSVLLGRDDHVSGEINGSHEVGLAR